MFESIKNGWKLIKESFNVFNRYPKFVVPLLGVWLIYAPVILYLKFWLNVDDYTTFQLFSIIIAVIFLFTFLLSFSCSVLLELVQQLESEQDLSLSKSLKSTFGHNIIRMLPIMIVWTIIWFILLLIQALLSKDRKHEKTSFSAENAARAIAGYREFSFSAAFFEALQKGVRMVVFLILPAIAWDNLGFWQATKKGLLVFRTNLTEFVTGFVTTGFVATVVFLPPAIIFALSEGDNPIVFPNWVWSVTLIYLAFAWSYSLYFEQMFTAQLYLWNSKWEKAVAKAQLESRPLPALKDIPQPSILDNIPELTAT